MAVDTRQRRASALRVAIPWMGCLPVSDGTIDNADRRMLTFLYSGLTSGGGGGSGGDDTNGLTRTITRPLTR